MSQKDDNKTEVNAVNETSKDAPLESTNDISPAPQKDPPPKKIEPATTPASVKKTPKREPKLIKEPITLAVLAQYLLKEPLDVTHSITRNAKLPWALLLGLTLGSFALFGLILGMFSGGDQLWAAPLKIAGGITFASLICLPSLFIFTSLCKVEAKLKTVLAILVCATCIVSLLLLGFIPILWLFSTTSGSLGFFGFLTFCTWVVCLFIGLNFIDKSVRYLGSKDTLPLKVWFFIFILVTLQLPTTLRPIIGETEEDFINFNEKKFFLEHWGELTLEKLKSDTEFHR